MFYCPNGCFPTHIPLLICIFRNFPDADFPGRQMDVFVVLLPVNVYCKYTLPSNSIAKTSIWQE